MTSSSLRELKTSNPPSFHSPLSEVNTDAVRIQPWTEVASLLMNLIGFWSNGKVSQAQKRGDEPTAMSCKPHFIVSGDRLFRLTCHDRGTSRSVAMYIYVSVCTIISLGPRLQHTPSYPL